MRGTKSLYKVGVALCVLFLVLGFFLTAKTRYSSAKCQVEISSLVLPPNFEAELFAHVKEPRQMAVSPSQDVFVGSRFAGHVYCISSRGGARKTLLVARGLNQPSGVALDADDTLYVAEIDSVLVYRQIGKLVEEALRRNDTEYIVSAATPEVWAEFPQDKHHGWKYIKFAPDGRLYVPVGSPCNTCLRDDERYSTIMRLYPFLAF